MVWSASNAAGSENFLYDDPCVVASWGENFEMRTLEDCCEAGPDGYVICNYPEFVDWRSVVSAFQGMQLPDGRVVAWISIPTPHDGGGEAGLAQEWPEVVYAGKLEDPPVPLIPIPFLVVPEDWLNRSLTVEELP